MSYALNTYSNVHNNSPFKAMKCRAVRDLNGRRISAARLPLFTTVALPRHYHRSPPKNHPRETQARFIVINIVRLNISNDL